MNLYRNVELLIEDSDPRRARRAHEVELIEYEVEGDRILARTRSRSFRHVTYKVVVEVADRMHNCECPDGRGGFRCKHVLATLFEFRRINRGKENQ
jgi:uncharacterized Zn finger protein